MQTAIRVMCLLAALLGACVPSHAAGRGNDGGVTMKDGWFVVNGEPFLVKGVCFFENHSVDGQFERSSPEILDYEFQRIREAGFNAIRSQLRPEEIELARKHGLMVLQGADYLFFSREYEDRAMIDKTGADVREIVGSSKRFDNILYYLIDNEPQIQEGVYRQGEPAVQAFYRTLMSAAKATDPRAILSMASYPPAAGLDHTVFDCVSLNLYPFCIACDAIGYKGYAEWFKNKYAADKPFVVSEYGWEVGRGTGDFSRTMMQRLDDQFDAGACGSFFFTWRAFGRESTSDNLWYGIVPSEGGKEDYRNPPRPIIDDFRTYFEAVIVEPKQERGYSGKVPVRVYGTDHTRRVEVAVGERRIRLKRKGMYWWEGTLALGAADRGPKTLVVEARGDGDELLVRKERTIFSVRKQESLRLQIAREPGPLAAGGTYKACVRVVDQDGKPVADQDLRLAVNETGRDLWGRRLLDGRTDKNGEYLFVSEPLAAGYFTLMAGAVTDRRDVRVLAGVDIVRVERGAAPER